MKYVDRMDNWSVIFRPLAGTHVAEAARLVLDYVIKDKKPLADGFTFNDVVVSVGKKDTVESIVERYTHDLEATK